MTKQAKIVVELVGYDCRMTKYFTGTDDEIYLEANDYMSDLIMRYFKDNNVQDPNEQEKIINSATHFIVFEKEIPTMMYAIVEAEDSEPQVLGVYATRAEAEEMFLTECDAAVYEMMNQHNAWDVFGTRAYNYKIDYKYLMRDAAETFSILEVPVFATMRED